MVQLIVGNKGKGKTKQLLDKVNSEIKEISGNIVYLDKSTKHMYELNNKVRLDSFLKIACLEGRDITPTVDKLETLSKKFDVKFILSISMDESELPVGLKDKILISL